MSRQRIVRNVLLLGTGQIVTWLISTAAIVVSGRYLGAGGFGVLQTAMAVTALMGLVVTLGMENYIVRTVARDPARSSVITSAALVARVGLSLFALGVFFLYAQITHLGGQLQFVIYVLAVIMIAGALSSALVSTLQGQERMTPLVINGTVTNLVDLILVVAVVKVHGGVELFAISGVPIAVAMLAVNVRWFTKHVSFCWRIPLRDIRDIIVGSLSFWLFAAFFTIYAWIDSVILAAIGGVSAVGIYAPSVRLFGVALFVPTILATATLPALSRLGIDPTVRFEHAGRKLIQLLIIMAVPLAVGLATFASPLMLTVYGPPFRLSVPVLAILSLCILPTFMNIQIGYTLIANNRQALWSVAMGAGCVINPAINLVLIRLAIHHWNNAAIGAAMALVVTEVLQTLFGIYLLRGMVWRKDVGITLLAALTAGVAQLATIYMTGFLFPPVRQVLGLLVYGVVALCCRVLPRHELNAIREAIVSEVGARYTTKPVHYLTEQPGSTSLP